MRTIGRPSRIKDAIGIAVLAVTALLYALGANHAETHEACASCEVHPVSPAGAAVDEPAAVESLISAAGGYDSPAA